MTAHLGRKLMRAGVLRGARACGDQLALRQIAESFDRAIAAGRGTHATACGAAR